MSAPDPLQDLYKELITIQRLILDSQDRVHKELGDLKACVNEKLAELETKVTNHETIFNHMTKVVTWLVPSSTMLAVIGWLAGLFGHK